MNLELIKELYQRATDKCVGKSAKLGYPNAWEFETALVQEITKYCADICMQAHYDVLDTSIPLGTSDFDRGIRCGKKYVSVALATKIREEFE